MFSIEYVFSPEVGGPQISSASRLSANLQISKFFYISEPSANVPFYVFFNIQTQSFSGFADLGFCGPNLFLWT
jgi:hypothetical protein